MKNHKFGVKVMPREVILDTQGRAVEQTLELHHMPAKCRVGKYIELEMQASSSFDGDAALAQAQKIAETLLCNPLIESYQIEMISKG